MNFDTRAGSRTNAGSPQHFTGEIFKRFTKTNGQLSSSHYHAALFASSDRFLFGFLATLLRKMVSPRGISKATIGAANQSSPFGKHLSRLRGLFG